jgi:hypothetical protein
MKYWEKLTNLESEIIRLDVLQSTVRVISSGIEGSNFTDIQQSYYLVDECLEDINKKITNEFNNLFEAIRQDTHDNDFGECDTTETDDLSNIMSQWIQTK